MCSGTAKNDRILAWIICFFAALELNGKSFVFGWVYGRFGLIILLYVNYFSLHSETLKFGGLQVSAINLRNRIFQFIPDFIRLYKLIKS